MPRRKGRRAAQDRISMAFTLTAAAAAKKRRLPFIQWLQDHGFEDISEGRATVSARIDSDQFGTLFHAEVKKLPPRPPGRDDLGRAGGFETPEDLAVPGEIADYVRAVAVIPPPERLDRPIENKPKRKG